MQEGSEEWLPLGGGGNLGGQEGVGNILNLDFAEIQGHPYSKSLSSCKIKIGVLWNILSYM